MRKAIGSLRAVSVLLIAPAAIILGISIVPVNSAAAADDTVTTCAGSGPGSLPAAVGDATSGDTITFSVSCPPGSPIVATTTIDIDVNLDIDGPGASEMAVSGNEAVQVFDISSGVTVDISGITVQDGNAAPGVNGGGISNAGTLNLSDSEILDNGAARYGAGGGIYNSGALDVSESTVSRNTARQGGGGIENEGTLEMTDSTVSDNSVFVGGEGIENDGDATISDSTISYNRDGNPQLGGILSGGPLTITASTVAYNDVGIRGGADLSATLVVDNRSNTGTSDDCSGGVTDNGYNLDDDGTCGFSSSNHSLSDVNADLTSLEDNGGPTYTEAPAWGSPAIDEIPVGAAGNGVTLCPGTDQRGVPRPQDGACDIGAVEVAVPAITSPDSASVTTGAGFTFTVTTSGSPVPALSEKGTLPKDLTFTDNGNGTATLAGSPKRAGVSRITIKALFGKGATKYVVDQTFKLKVSSG